MNLILTNFLNLPYDLQLETRNWRNSDNVAKFFKLQHISKETHIDWLEKLKEEKPKAIAFLISENGENIGVTYFHSIDYQYCLGDWGIYIHNEKYRGKGVGKFALCESIRRAKNELHLDTLFLDVRSDNKVALRLYEKYGFSPVSRDGDFIRYRKVL